VNGIFPTELIEKYSSAELVNWQNASAKIPPVSVTAHKYERGLVEIRAGSQGASGAALLASLGAQAAGAGLVRLIVDPSLYPIIAPSCSGVMAVPNNNLEENRFSPSAMLLGPGWGKAEDRSLQFEKCLQLEKQGIPLILDADVIPTGLSKDEILSHPIPILREFAAQRKVYILLKSHILYVASPDGRIGVIDGMDPVLATGGSGDVLAGFCAAIASRSIASGSVASKNVDVKQRSFDGYDCACAAASLLIRAAQSKGVAGTFADPAEFARAASAIAGSAWLPERTRYER
jgi:NAD(P)H-hydrate epimerase